MNARKDYKRSFDRRLDARLVLAATRRSFVARVDRLVARWLARAAAKAEAAQRLFDIRSSFRDGPKDQARNLEIPGSMLRIAPE
jgi:hypothetical protein